MHNSSTKHVGARRSTILSHPLQLVFPAFMIMKSLGKNDHNKFVSSLVNSTPGTLYNGKREYLLFLKTVILLVVVALVVVELLCPVF
jgi:hypothetical protein